MFDELGRIDERPKPFEFYTAEDLWTDEHISARMLSFHLHETLDMASRNRKFINRSVEWITSRFCLGKNSTIADFGCGPGLYTNRLAEYGAHITGIDFSERSIEYARKNAVHENLNVRYIKQNYLDFETEERFDLVLMIMCDFCALSPAQRKKMLSKFHTITKPGGRVLLDVYSMADYEQREETAKYEMNLLDGFWSPNPYFGFLNIFKYDIEKVVLDKYTIVEPHCTRTVYNWLQYFTPEKLETEFADSEFCIEALYADVAGSAYDPNLNEFAVVAKKNSTAWNSTE